MDGFTDLAGSRIESVNLIGAHVHGVLLVGTKVTDAYIDSLDLSGHVGSLVVNGVEVAGYVQRELERRHPELKTLESRDLDAMRATWATLQEIGAATLATARTLPASALDESVDGEFSYLQTLRHLVFATDRWITGPVLGEADHFHPLGYSHDSAPPEERRTLDHDARPTLDEVLAVRAGRMASVDTILRDSVPAALERVVDSPNGGTTTVGDCVRIVFIEEWWHHRYADRDLAILAARG